MAYNIARTTLHCAARVPVAAPVVPTLRPLLPLRRPNLPSISRYVHSTPPRRATATSTTAYSTGSTCSQCGTPFPPKLCPLCPSCSALLPPPPPTTTFFELFGLRPAYDLDIKALKRVFLQLQQKVHPDMFSGKGDVENWAKAWSGRVNDAYKALVNERERGEYLLSLHDVTIGEGDPVTDPELLMNIMETREALEQASTEEEVAEIRRSNADATKEAVSALSSALSATPPDLETARNLVIELKYFDNIDTVCKEWQPGQRIELQH
ncbi:hypothetical protein JCM11641_006986 [Rhodosporidiobolus odoratus]